MKNLICRVALILVFAVITVVAADAHAATTLLPNPTITASQTPHSGSYVAANVFNQDPTQTSLPGGSGLVYATGSPTSANADAFINFDFGSPRYITEYHFWDRANDNDTVFGFNLILDDNSDFSSPIRTFTFSEPIGGSDFALLPDDGANASRETFPFSSAANSPVSGITAQYARWEVTSSQGIYDGATEMRFYTDVSHIHHWKLDGDATASVGTGGTLNGTTAVTSDRNGNAGGAIDFQNTGRVNVTGLDPTPTNSFSVAAWAKHDTDTTSYSRIVDNIYNSGFYLGSDTSANDRYLFIVNASDGDFSNDAFGSTIDTAWHHLVGAYDSTTNTSNLYVDGIPVGQGTPDASPGSIATLTIGANSGGGEQWDGPIDDVGLWNLELEAKDIALIHALSKFSELDFDDSRIADVLAVFDNQTGSASSGNATWYYSANLNQGTTIGTMGGSVGGGDAYIVLGGDGSGVTIVPEPSTFALAALGLLGLLARGWWTRRGITDSGF